MTHSRVPTVFAAATAHARRDSAPALARTPLRTRAASLLGTIALLAAGLWLPPAFASDLLEVYRAAYDNDPVLGAARANLNATSEVLPQARAGLLPSVSVGASYSETRRDTEVLVSAETFDSRGWQVQLSQPVFNVERWHTWRGAQARTDQAELNFIAQEQALAVRVAEAYLDVLRAQDLLESAQAEEAAVQRQLEQVQQRFDVGLVAITDVLESTAIYDNALVRVIQAEGDHGTFFETLRTLTGQLHPELARLDRRLPVVSPEPTDEEEWVRIAFATNPTVRSARELVRAAERDVAARRAAHYPTLNATASHTYQSTGGTQFLGGRSDTTSYGVQFQMPIYQGGLPSSRTREAEYRLDEARERLREREYLVERDTRNLYRFVMTDVMRVRARERSIESSVAALEATQTGYEVGTRNIVEVLQAQQRLYQAQFDYADSRYRYVLNMLRLKQSAGTLSADDLAFLNEHMDRSDPVRQVHVSASPGRHFGAVEYRQRPLR
jgi:outer membrane protein